MGRDRESGSPGKKAPLILFRNQRGFLVPYRGKDLAKAYFGVNEQNLVFVVKI